MKRKKLKEEDGAQQSEDQADLPEEVTLIQGREEAQRQRRDERESKRRVAAEAKRKRQLRSSKKRANDTAFGGSGTSQLPERVAEAEYDPLDDHVQCLNTREQDPSGAESNKQLIKDVNEIQFGSIDIAQLVEEQNTASLSKGPLQDGQLSPPQASDRPHLLFQKDGHEQIDKDAKGNRQSVFMGKEINTLRFGSIDTADLPSPSEAKKNVELTFQAEEEYTPDLPSTSEAKKNDELTFQAEEESIPTGMLLDDNVVKFLTAREQSQALESLQNESTLPEKLKEKQKSKVKRTAVGSLRLMLIEDLPDSHHKTAMEFRHDRLFGNHRPRSYSMLKKMVRGFP